MDLVNQHPLLHGTIIMSSSNAKSQSTENYHCKGSAKASMDLVDQLPQLHGTIIMSSSNIQSHSTKNYHCKSTWLIFRIRLRSQHSDRIIYSSVPRISRPSLVIKILNRKEGQRVTTLLQI